MIKIKNSKIVEKIYNHNKLPNTIKSVIINTNQNKYKDEKIPSGNSPNFKFSF